MWLNCLKAIRKPKTAVLTSSYTQMEKKYSVFFGFTDYTIDPIVNKKIPVGGGFGEKVFRCAVDAMAWIDGMLY